MKKFRVLVCLFMAMLLCGACLGLEDPTPVVSYPTDDALDLSAGGTANCYIVSQGGKYSIDAVKGNSSEKVGDVASVEVLWESFGTSEVPSVGSLISSVSYSDGKINYTIASPFREGNAVIAAKDASGTILWSWHIWLTDQPEECVYANNAGIMMDRNLGATSATPGDVGALGLLYQWGRKDPFLGSSSINSGVEAKSTISWPSAVQSDASNGTISYATEHPTMLILNSSNNHDWYYIGNINTKDTRWQIEKTIYDPCPAGWRVPDGGNNGIWAKANFPSGTVIYTYDSSNQGMLFGAGISSPASWYPAAGYRSYYNGGDLMYVGNHGDYWSVSAYGGDIDGISTLYFDSGGTIFRAHGNYRTCSLPVRCQKDETVVVDKSGIEEALALPDGSPVELEGVADGITRRGFVLLDEESMVYVYRGPDWSGGVTSGDRVKVTGTISTYRGNREISLSDVVVTGRSEIPYHTTIQLTSANISNFSKTQSGACKVEFDGNILLQENGYYTIQVGNNNDALPVLEFPVEDYSSYIGKDVKVTGYYLWTTDPTAEVSYTRLAVAASDVVVKHDSQIEHHSPSNCYIVSASGSYKFAANKGNSSSSIENIASVDVLWESFGTSEVPQVGSLISSASYIDGKINYTVASPFREGNAVLAARDASGTILWSWHIWLTDQPKEHVYYNNAGTMMDRNLGATSATPGDVGALGLLYQWGRKDPFLGSSSRIKDEIAQSTISWPDAVSSDYEIGTIEYTIAHPTTFIGYNQNNNDWYYSNSSLGADNTRWTTSDNDKSIYDPCPSGWRVPDGGAAGIWAKSISTESPTEGENMSGIFGEDEVILYPWSGIRLHAGGLLYGVGSYGHFWTASTYIYYAYCLFSSYYAVDVLDYYFRADGYSVRCQKM